LHTLEQHKGVVRGMGGLQPATFCTSDHPLVNCKLDNTYEILSSLEYFLSFCLKSRNAKTDLYVSLIVEKLEKILQHSRENQTIKKATPVKICS